MEKRDTQKIWEAFRTSTFCLQISLMPIAWRIHPHIENRTITTVFVFSEWFWVEAIIFLVWHFTLLWFSWCFSMPAIILYSERNMYFLLTIFRSNTANNYRQFQKNKSKFRTVIRARWGHSMNENKPLPKSCILKLIYSMVLSNLYSNLIVNGSKYNILVYRVK